MLIRFSLRGKLNCLRSRSVAIPAKTKATGFAAAFVPPLDLELQPYAQQPFGAGFTARTKPLINFPSTSEAMASRSSPEPWNDLRASSSE